MIDTCAVRIGDELLAQRTMPVRRLRPGGNRSVLARLRFVFALLAIAFCLASLASLSNAADDRTADAKRVLVVYENESSLFAVTEVASAFHAALADPAPIKFEFYSEYLDTVRFPSPDHSRRLFEIMAAKYSDVSLDAVAAVGPSALRFMLQHRNEIAPGVPLIFGGVSNESLRNISLPPDVLGVLSRFDVMKTVDLASRLLPETKRVVVLTGSSAFDRSWEVSARQDLASRHNGLEIAYLSGLSLNGFKDAAGKLPADTILLVLSVFEDAEGRKYIPRDAVREIAPASGAPVFSVYSSYIGTGVVGGFMETFTSIGQDMARLVGEVVSGKEPASQIVPSTGRPVVDWRQMRRWGIDAALLPENTQLQFYEPSAWERYRLQIVGALAIIILQTATIAGLIVLERRRRRIKEELALERLELAHLSRITQLGELSGSIAHELTQPLTSILANAEAGARLVDQDGGNLAEIKEILNDIVADDKRAAQIIAQLRQMMTKGQVTFEQLNLNDVVESTTFLAKSELVARQTKVEFKTEQFDLPIKGNLAQLQQVVLNLLLNAAEAMSNKAPGMRWIEIFTRTRDDGMRELSVADRGDGLSHEMRINAFKPFVSTKANGLGLGLSICRSIALAHGGTLQFDENYEGGARALLTLPPAARH